MPTPFEIALDAFVESSGLGRSVRGTKEAALRAAQLVQQGKDSLSDQVTKSFTRPISEGAKFAFTDISELAAPQGTQLAQTPSLEAALAGQAVPPPQQAAPPPQQAAPPPQQATNPLDSPLPGSLDPGLSPLPGAIQTAPSSRFFGEPVSTIAQALAPEPEPGPKELLGLSAEVLSDLGLTQGAEFLQEGGLVESAPSTIGPTSLFGGTSQFAGGAGGTLTFGDGTTIDVSGATPTGGLVIRNPFTDDALSGKQQKDIAEQQEQIQKVAETAKRTRLRERFRKKWQKVRRVLDDPALPIEVKRQIENQTQIDLRELGSEDPEELFDAFAAQDSPELNLTRQKQVARTEGAALYGSQAAGDTLADSLNLDAEGKVDRDAYNAAKALFEARRIATVQHDRQIELKRADEKDQRFKSIRDLTKVASDILGNPEIAGRPEGRAAFVSRLIAHQREFGGLDLASLEGKPFNFETVNQVLYGLPPRTGRTSAVDSAPVSQPSLGSRPLQTNDFIPNATPADLERAREEVDRLHDAGQLNASIRFSLPNGRIGTIK